MNRLHLISLRKDGIKEFNNAKELYNFTTKFFGENYICPMVVGDINKESELWLVNRIDAKSTDAKLTIINYLAGIKKLSEDKNGKNRKYFFDYKGINSYDEKSDDRLFLNIRVQDKEQEYFLDVWWVKNIEQFGRTKYIYNSCSKISPTKLEKICGNYVNKK